jgi:hypothetical protein
LVSVAAAAEDDGPRRTTLTSPFVEVTARVVAVAVTTTGSAASTNRELDRSWPLHERRRR